MYMMQPSVLKDMVNRDERIIWWGKPHRAGLILEALFTPFAILALCWGTIDAFISIDLFLNKTDIWEKVGGVAFMMFHMCPVWLYIGMVVHAFRSGKKTEYIVTDKMFYHWTGSECISCPLVDYYHISYKQGFWDKKFNIGDICFHSREEGNDLIENITDFQRAFFQIRDAFIYAKEQEDTEKKNKDSL